MAKTSQPQLLLNEHLFRAGQRIGLAVSGGADSVALLRALLDRRQALGLVLSVVHVHHGIRGEEADRDQVFVEALAASSGLTLHVKQVDTPAYAKQHGATLEEAARDLRYAFFRELLRTGQMDAIATAHTLDDQAETVLQKLLRGAWTEGLGGISPVRTEVGGRILRPLLGATRAEVESFLRAVDQPWCEDATNREMEHTRNRVRHELLPVLRGYNPQIAAQLSRVAAIARDEEEYWQREIARIGPGLVLPGKPVRGGGRSASTHPDETSIAMEIERLRPLGTALQRRVLRWAAAGIGCNLNFEQTERLMALCGFAGDAPGKRVDLDPTAFARRTAREIQLVRHAATEAATENVPPKLEILLPVPGEVEVPELGLRFRTVAALLQSPIPPALIRYPRAGDRATPRHTSGPRSIKDVLERRQMPAADRQKTPLVAWEGHILWLRGVDLDPASLPPLPFTLEVASIL